MKTVIAVFMVFALSGCATMSNKSNSEKVAMSLISAKEAIVSIATSVDLLCTTGQLNQKQCDKAALAYERSQKVYDVAAESLKIALATNDQGAWVNYTNSRDSFYRLYGEIVQLAYELKILGGGK